MLGRIDPQKLRDLSDDMIRAGTLLALFGGFAGLLAVVLDTQHWVFLICLLPGFVLFVVPAIMLFLVAGDDGLGQRVAPDDLTGERVWGSPVSGLAWRAVFAFFEIALLLIYLFVLSVAFMVTTP